MSEVAEETVNPAVAPTETPAGPKEVPAAPSEPAKGAEPETDTGADVPLFFSRSATREDQPAGIDPSKLSPELQTLYKSMQADYTRKTQALADDRRKFLEDREAWVNKTTAERPQPTETTDPMTEVRRLREEGQHEEADRLLVEISEKVAEERLRPLEDRARVQSMQAEFRNIVQDTIETMPVVAHYKEAVREVFDSQNPEMKAIRSVVLANEKNLWMVKPLMYLLAMEQHALAQEKSRDAAIKKGIKEGIQKEIELARKSPTRLVPGSTTSSETSPNRSRDIMAAINLAKAGSAQ